MKAEVFRARFDYVKVFLVRSTDHFAVKLHDTKRQQWIEGPRLLSELAIAQQEALLLAKSHIEGHGDKPAQDADSVKWVGPMHIASEHRSDPGRLA